MKKILACLMCLIMTLCCSVTAFASELPYDGAEGSATVTYNVDSSYCVIIPETIDGKSTLTLTASRVNITSNLQVAVYCKSLQTEEYIELSNSDGEKANFRFDGMKDNNCVGAFHKGDLTSYFSVNGTVNDEFDVAAGTYTGTAEFTVQITTADAFS